MLFFPQKGALRTQHNFGSVGATAYGATVAGGAAAAKGAPVQLFASTDFDTYWIRIYASDYGASGVASGGCLDILAGAATESIIIPDLLMGNSGGARTANRGTKQWDFPLYIPAGTRLSAAISGERNTGTCRVAVCLYGGNGVPGWRVGSKVTTYGVVSTIAGTPLTPGGPAVEGAWFEIASATSRDHFALIPSFQCGADTAMGIETYSNDLGIGAAGVEVALDAGPYIYGASSSELMDGPSLSMPAFCDIPSGTRLVMRSSVAGATGSAGSQGAIHAMS